MHPPARTGGAGLLWTLVLLGGVYCGLLFLNQGRLTDSPQLDGSVGVLLGLLISARGASYLVDVLQFGRVRPTLGRVVTRAGWAAINLLVLAIGCCVIALGAMQFARVLIPAGG